MKNQEHFHIWDLPRSIFPRKKGNKARKYSTELGRLYGSLSYTETKLQYAAQISIFNIKSITRKGGYGTSPQEVFSSIEDFVYHYENFCFRAYAVREKIIHFLNSVLEIGFEDKEVKIRLLLMTPQVRNSKLLSSLKKFDGNTALARVIKDRNALTHQLYFNEKFDHYLRPMNSVNKDDGWFIEWRKQILSHVKRANDAARSLSQVNHDISEEVVNLRE